MADRANTMPCGGLTARIPNHLEAGLILGLDALERSAALEAELGHAVSRGQALQLGDQQAAEIENAYVLLEEAFCRAPLLSAQQRLAHDLMMIVEEDEAGYRHDLLADLCLTWDADDHPGLPVQRAVQLAESYAGIFAESSFGPDLPDAPEMPVF